MPETIDVGAIAQSVLPYLLPALWALLLFVVGSWLAKRVSRAALKLFNASPNADPTLSRFFASLIRYSLLLVVAIAALSVLGVDMTSVAGMVLAAGAALAFVLQGALGNLAAGVMIMIFRPYNVGDEIEIGDVKGVVSAVELTATRLQTRDNIELIVANGDAWGGVIRNHSALGQRRLDMNIGVSYDADIDQAIAAILSVAEADERIHADPAPWAKVVNLGDSSVDIQLRVWCEYDDLRGLKVSLSQPIKAALDKAGIGIPYPHVIKIRQMVKTSKARDRIKKLTALRKTSQKQNA